MKEEAVLYLENQLCFPLYAASRLTTKLYGPFLQKLDMTYPQYLVMLVLWQKGQQSVSKISEKLYLESNTLTPLLKRMEQKELIRRTRSKTDERTVLISLTPKGKQLKTEAICIPTQVLDRFEGDEMTMEEIDQLKKTLDRLVEVLYENVK